VRELLIYTLLALPLVMLFTVCLDQLGWLPGSKKD
jgi:hypothetical protein